MDTRKRSGMCAFVVAGLCGSAIGSAASAQIFQRAYGTPAQEVALDITDLYDCDYATVGIRSVAGIPSAIQGVRYNSDGNILWSKQYLLTQGNNAGYTLVEAGDRALIFGCESAFGGVAVGKLVFRVTPAGIPIWGTLLQGTPFVPSIAPAAGTLGVSVREIFNKQIASVNRQVGALGVSRVGVLTVQTAAGILVIERAYIPPGSDASELDFSEVRQARFPTGSNDLLIVGNILDVTVGRYGAFAMRTDSAGNIIWAREYLHPSAGISITADGFALDGAGDLIFSGRRGPAVPGQLSPSDLIVAKLDHLTGAPIWALDVDGFTNGYQAVIFTPARTAVIAGMVSPGAAAPINSASLIEVSGAGVFIRQQIYGPFVAGFNVRGEGVTNWRPWGGYAMGGVTNDIGAGGNDIYFVKTYTDFTSGCRERIVDPVRKPVALAVKTPGIQVASSDLWQPVNVPVNDITMLTTTPCFTKRCVGDLNGDGFVDDDDFVIFANAYNTLICPTNPALYSCCPADFNGDGFVDDDDFVLFANAYNALLCP
ncbi:MAG: hypothetical protein KF691_03975 [Phycisphaeraceae bacterium]|nr:hypothetical protein [Phycisphaeraceae bacterium]